MVAAAGGAPAVTTLTPRGTSPRTATGALARAMSTVGAAHSQLTCSLRMSSNTRAGSTLGRHTCTPPTAVTIHTNVHPLAWNIGSVHRYLSSTPGRRWTSVPTTFIQALRCVIITPLGLAVVPLV